MKFILYLILFSSLNCFAQRDYLILQSNDTIRGKYVSANPKVTRFLTDSGKVKIPTHSVKEIRIKNEKYLVYENPFVNDYMQYKVLADGKATLLYDRESDPTNVDCLDFVVINNTLYPIETHYFSDQVWDILIKCADFEERYKSYKAEKAGKKILVLSKNQRQQWTDMVTFYNHNCGG